MLSNQQTSLLRINCCELLEQVQNKLLITFNEFNRTLTRLIQSLYNSIATALCCRLCNNLVAAGLCQSCLISPLGLYCPPSCSHLGTSSASTSCWPLVDRLAASCVIFMRVHVCLFFHFHSTSFRQTRLWNTSCVGRRIFFTTGCRIVKN